LLFIFLKKKEIEFLLAAVLFTYSSGTVQNRNFGAVAGEVILVNSCAVIVIYFSKKKRDRIFACGATVHLRQWYCSKQILWWN